MTDVKQMAAIKVKDDVKELVPLVQKKVITETGGEVTTITDAMKYVFEAYLGNLVPKQHWSES